MRLVLAALLLAFTGLSERPAADEDRPDPGTILDTRTGERIDREALVRRLAGADVTVLGEVHDNPVHHERQAWLIERLAPDGVAFEMVPQAAEAALAAARTAWPDAAARLASLPDLLDWEESGWPDWALYRPVFAAAGDAVLTGGGVPREALMKAVAEGAAAAYGSGAEALGLTEPLAPHEQAAVQAEMLSAHCDALPEEMLPGMVEAQRLRDARFAAAALRARGTSGRAVLITGNGHARRDRGVPAYLARLAPEARVLSLGQIEVGGKQDPGDAPDDLLDLPYDLVWFSAPAEREDPCAAFAVERKG